MEQDKHNHCTIQELESKLSPERVKSCKLSTNTEDDYRLQLIESIKWMELKEMLLELKNTLKEIHDKDAFESIRKQHEDHLSLTKGLEIALTLLLIGGILFVIISSLRLILKLTIG